MQIFVVVVLILVAVTFYAGYASKQKIDNFLEGETNIRKTTEYNLKNKWIPLLIVIAIIAAIAKGLGF